MKIKNCSAAERKTIMLMRFLDRLKLESENGALIIVEGKKDLIALETLGIKGNVLCIKSSRKGLVDFLDEIKQNYVIVFLDFDRRGTKLTKDVITYLEAKGIVINLLYWRSIGALIRRDVKDIEGIPSYLEKLKKSVETQWIKK
jgi:5S rRNA maturation endonuclease (ribonuclease M5)